VYGLYYQTSNITINTLNSSQFNYTIIPSTASPDIYYIQLDFSTSISNHPVLTLNLNPPDAVLYNTSTTLQLSTTKVETSLLDYYALDAAAKAMVDATTSGSDGINSAAGSAFAANNFLLGSSFGIKSLVSMDIIRFLRYFLIDYPPNVLAMYQSTMPTSDLVPNVNINEDPADGSLPDIFNNYSLSTYCFNNNGNLLIEASVYASVGILMILLMKISKKTKNLYFRVLIILCRLIFVWNYALSYFLSQFMVFALGTFLAFRYPTEVTAMGKFNYAFAFFSFVLIFFVFAFSFYIIIKLRPRLKSKMEEEEQQEKLNEEKSISNPLPHSNSNTSSRALKGAENSNTVFPEPFSPSFSPVLKRNEEIDEVKELSKDVSKKQKTVNFDKANEKTMDEISGEVTPTLNKSHKTMKASQFKKIEMTLDGKDKLFSKPPVLTKTIIINNPNLQMNEENNITIAQDGGKTKDIYLNNAFDYDIKAEGQDKPGILPSLFRKLSKALPMHFFDSSNTTNSKVPWLNRLKTKINSLLTKKSNNTLDWRKDDEIEMEKNLDLLTKSFFPLHRDYNHKRAIQSFYVIFDLLRQTLFSLLVVLTFDTPFRGLIFVNLINIAYFVGYFIIRPFRETPDLIQNFLNEVCLLISSLSAFIMASMEKFNSVHMETKMTLGWIMVFANTFLILMFLFRVGVNFVGLIYLMGRLAITLLVKKFRKTLRVEVEKKPILDGNKNKKEEDQVAFQQLLDIMNFLR